ncbi:hypothetical protein HYU92_04880 [Candidatus Curtissbacteria bacterium]|nr:hypothetical protein [Candidatus Curtissbacteria bacterium]
MGKENPISWLINRASKLPEITRITRKIKEHRFAARIGDLAHGARSQEAITNAIGVYLLSGGSFEEDSYFETYIPPLAEAIEKDEVDLQQTEDLGISQALRLRRFLKKIQPESGDQEALPPDISNYKKTFA